MSLAPYVRKGKSVRAIGDFGQLKVQATVMYVGSQALAAAGATQGNAAQITASRVHATCTTSAQGLRLPLPATAGNDAEIEVYIPGTKGVKVYPDTNAQIDAAATNGALSIVAGKAVRFRRKDATHWITFKSA